MSYVWGYVHCKYPFILINSDYQPTNLEATDRYGLRVELMAGVGHFVMMEDAEAFNHLLGIALQEMKTRKAN